jgi:hypothetical protein
VEELVAGSNTGKAPQLCDYYSYWEMAVFNALVLMVLKGLENLHSMLTKKPLFKASNTHLALHLCCCAYKPVHKPHVAPFTSAKWTSGQLHSCRPNGYTHVVHRVC